jgi:predicted TIM-barrel fold metal-dependent hydrolase
MGLFDSDAPDARETLRNWRGRPGMLGFRFSARDPKYDTALTSGRMDWVWAAAEEHGIPVMMSVDPEEVTILQDIAARHPGLKIAVDHMARKHGAKDAAAFPAMGQLLALSRLENVSVKASGLPSYSGQRYPYPAMIDAFKAVVDAFGPMRVFWGADMTKLPCSYKQAVEMFTQEIPWLHGADKEAVMGGALSQWLGWP